MTAVSDMVRRDKQYLSRLVRRFIGTVQKENPAFQNADFSAQEEALKRLIWSGLYGQTLRGRPEKKPHIFSPKDFTPPAGVLEDQQEASFTAFLNRWLTFLQEENLRQDSPDRGSLLARLRDLSTRLAAQEPEGGVAVPTQEKTPDWIESLVMDAVGKAIVPPQEAPEAASPKRSVDTSDLPHDGPARDRPDDAAKRVEIVPEGPKSPADIIATVRPSYFRSGIASSVFGFATGAGLGYLLNTASKIAICAAVGSAGLTGLPVLIAAGAAAGLIGGTATSIFKSKDQLREAWAQAGPQQKRWTAMGSVLRQSLSGKQLLWNAATGAVGGVVGGYVVGGLLNGFTAAATCVTDTVGGMLGLEPMSETIAELVTENSELGQTLDAQQTQVATLESDLAHAQEAQQNLNEQLDVRAAEVEALQEQLAAQQDANADLREDNIILNEQLVAAEEVRAALEEFNEASVAGNVETLEDIFAGIPAVDESLLAEITDMDVGIVAEAEADEIMPPALYTVQSGDSLWSIAARHFEGGTVEAMEKIIAANAHIEGLADKPWLIHPDLELIIPGAEAPEAANCNMEMVNARLAGACTL